MIKTDALGNVVWEQIIEGGFGSSIIETNDLGYAIVGYGPYSTYYDYIVWLVKTDALGNVVWKQTYDRTIVEAAYSLVETYDGCFVITGWIEKTVEFGNNLNIIKTDNLGNVIWDRTYGYEGSILEIGFDVIETSDRAYLVAGYVELGKKIGNYYMVKVDSDGEILWKKIFPTDIAGRNIPYSVIESSHGGYLAVGQMWSGSGIAGFGLLYLRESDVEPPIITINNPLDYGIYTIASDDFYSFDVADSVDPNPLIKATITNVNGMEYIVNSGDPFPTQPGIYTLDVGAVDASGNSASESTAFIIYDPEGGFATGGGWIIADGESTLSSGRANFGFVAKYKKGVSTGNLEFQYQDAEINLKSMTIDWLTISSNKAIFQGTGTINNEGLYTFRVMADDNGEPGAEVDLFNIKIWEGINTEVDPVHKAKNTISGGNIIVHKK